MHCLAVADEAAAKSLNLEQVRAEKQSLKLLRRQMKELDSLQRRHTKERSDVQRQQCAIFDKQLQLHKRQRLQAERNGSKKKKSVFTFSSSHHITWRKRKQASTASVSEK